MTIIPLTDEPSQSFNLTLEGNQYECTLNRNERMGVWILGIKDSDGNPVIEGQALVLGQKILSQYNLDLGQFMMADTENTNIDAGPDDLGTRVVLVYLTEEDLESGSV